MKTFFILKLYDCLIFQRNLLWFNAVAIMWILIGQNVVEHNTYSSAKIVIFHKF